MQEVYIRTLEIMEKHNKRHSSNKPVKRKEEAIVPRIPKKEEAKVPRIPKLTTMLKTWSRGDGVDREQHERKEGITALGLPHNSPKKKSPY